MPAIVCLAQHAANLADKGMCQRARKSAREDGVLGGTEVNCKDMQSAAIAYDAGPACDGGP